MKLRHLLLMCVLLALMVGCTAYRSMIETNIEFITETGAEACLCFQGTGGGGMGATLNGSASGFMAFGDIDPSVCTDIC